MFIAEWEIGFWPNSSAAALSDIDGDSKPEMLIGANNHGSGGVYLVPSQDITNADDADDVWDGTVWLVNVPPLAHS